MVTPRQPLVPVAFPLRWGGGSLLSASVRFYPAAVVACRLQLITRLSALCRGPAGRTTMRCQIPFSAISTGCASPCAGQANAGSAAAGQRIPIAESVPCGWGPQQRNLALRVASLHRPRVEGFRTDHVARALLLAGRRCAGPRCTASCRGSAGSSPRPPSSCCNLTGP
jgi:hypothetical protein